MQSCTTFERSTEIGDVTNSSAFGHTIIYNLDLFVVFALIRTVFMYIGVRSFVRRLRASQTVED
jgi:hypothetical protein